MDFWPLSCFFVALHHVTITRAFEWFVSDLLEGRRESVLSPLKCTSSIIMVDQEESREEAEAEETVGGLVPPAENL